MRDMLRCIWETAGKHALGILTHRAETARHQELRPGL